MPIIIGLIFLFLLAVFFVWVKDGISFVAGLILDGVNLIKEKIMSSLR